MRLLHSLGYLRIKHKAKHKYDIVYPVIFAAFVAGGAISFKVKIVGSDGLVAQVNSLAGILIGFYIAALAAVATFSKPSMDDPMQGEPPILMYKERGKVYEIPISRRIFLSQLFGFLTVVSLITYSLGVAGNLLGERVQREMHGLSRAALSITFLYSYCLLYAYIIINTLLGVYYLSFRIHDLGSKRIKDS